MDRTEDIDDLVNQVAALQASVDELRARVGKEDLAYSAPVHVGQSDFLRMLYEERRLREECFGDPDLFGEPAWDILLDLAISENDARQVAVGDACIASNVPYSTGLRWVRLLESKGLIEIVADRRDQRRKFVRLTRVGRAQMRRFVKQAAVLRGAVHSG